MKHTDRNCQSVALREAKEWFQLAHYEEAKTMSPQSWAHEIQRRLLLQLCIEKSLQADPLGSWCEQAALQSLRDIMVQPIDGRASTELPAIQSISGSTFANHIALWMLLDPQNCMYAPLWVNRGASDKDLRSGLEKFLVERTKTSLRASLAPGVGHGTRLQRWHVALALPYADLTLWGSCTGYTLSEAEKVHLLFTPDETFDGKSFDRSKLKRAREAFKQLFRLEQVWALASYVPPSQAAATKKRAKKSSS